ncbi:hypothetical protein [Hymenobacter sp. BT559]|nr:hypothetical protein [Hymenobacter sp. BT559]MBJ6145141.1 hypothetical protein [Hymenobacter sp. BT559]
MISIVVKQERVRLSARTRLLARRAPMPGSTIAAASASNSRAAGTPFCC